MRNVPFLRARLAVAGLTLSAVATPLSLVQPVAAASPQIAGRVTSQPGSTAPTIFTFRRGNGQNATISVSASTVVVRRYGARTDIGGVSIGDALQLWGTFEAGGTVFDATRIQDNSIQAADAYGRGKVLSVNASANTLTATITGGLFSRTGSTVTITVPAGQAIPLPGGGTTGLANVQVGDTIYVRGVYNRSSKAFTSVNAFRVLKVVTTPSIKPASVSVGGFAFQRHHFAVVLVHTIPSAAVQIEIHVQGRTITASGTADSGGNFQTVPQIGYGAWAGLQHVQTVVKLVSGSAQRTVTRWTWIA